MIPKMAGPPPERHGLEPNPFPNDLPSSAPILHDVEQGYNTTETLVEAPLHDDQAAKGSSPAGIEKRRKERGKGLTEGDQGG